MTIELPEHACAYCSWDKGLPEDYHTAQNRVGPMLRVEEVEVCTFCYNGLAASGWLCGSYDQPTDPRDMSTFANILLAEIRMLAQR